MCVQTGRGAERDTEQRPEIKEEIPFGFTETDLGGGGECLSKKKTNHAKTYLVHLHHLLKSLLSQW